ncbi:hypothetical protein PoMZ_02340, partial [Pyricularia oryzae]
ATASSRHWRLWRCIFLPEIIHSHILLKIQVALWSLVSHCHHDTGPKAAANKHSHIPSLSQFYIPTSGSLERPWAWRD